MGDEGGGKGRHHLGQQTCNAMCILSEAKRKTETSRVRYSKLNKTLEHLVKKRRWKGEGGEGIAEVNKALLTVVCFPTYR